VGLLATLAASKRCFCASNQYLMHESRTLHFDKYLKFKTAKQSDLV